MDGAGCSDSDGGNRAGARDVETGMHPPITHLARIALLSLAVVAGGTACSDDDEPVATTGGSSTTGATTEPTGAPTAEPATTTGPAATEPGSTEPSEPTPTIDPAGLTESWGCGYGFRMSDPDQTRAVVIEWQGDMGSAAEIPMSVELPADGWRAEIQTGSDLFSNWCNDVVMPDLPTPVVTDTWVITDGTLTITGATTDPCGGAGEVTAVLADAVATDDEGATVALDELTLVNDTWGCFAG